jgi:hypothetical protein
VFLSAGMDVCCRKTSLERLGAELGLVLKYLKLWQFGRCNGSHSSCRRLWQGSRRTVGERLINVSYFAVVKRDSEILIRIDIDLLGSQIHDVLGLAPHDGDNLIWGEAQSDSRRRRSRRRGQCPRRNRGRNRRGDLADDPRRIRVLGLASRSRPFPLELKRKLPSWFQVAPCRRHGAK